MTTQTSTNKIKKCPICFNPMATMYKDKDRYEGFKCFKCKIEVKK